MKKLTALVLVISMLFSLVTVSTADEVSNVDLNAKDYNYINIKPNIDAFASAKVIRNYAVFQAVESSDSSSAFNELHTVTEGDNTYTYRTRIPSKTHDGSAEIDGTESYYKKGIGYFDIDGERIYSSQGHTPLIYATESFKHTADEIKNTRLDMYKGISSTTTAKMVAAAPDTYASTTFGFPGVNDGIKYMPSVEEIEADGSNYNVILKDSNTDAKFKIGPINDKEFVKNAVDYVKGGTHTVTLPEGTKGDTLAIAATTANVNDGGTVSGFSGDLLHPRAALLSVQISYKIEETEEKYIVLTNNAKSNDMVGSAIVYGPKKNGDVEIDYSKSENLSQLNYYEDSGLTLDDVKFPSNVSGGEMNFAFGLRASQHDNYTDIANKINVGSFQIKDDEVTTIKFVNDTAPGDNAIEGIIRFDRNDGKAKNVRALIPVTIDNDESDESNEEYAYFLYVSRVTQQPAVFGATIMTKSLQEKIDAIEAEIEKLSDTYVPSEGTKIYEIHQQIEALKAEGVLSTDFDANLYAKIEDLYEKHENYAQQGELLVKDLTEILNSLPESYSKEAGKTAAEAKSIIDSLTEAGITEDNIKSLTNYAKYESHLALYNEWLNASNSQDRVVINWTENDNTRVADIFEFSDATIDKISLKQGIVTSSTNTVLPSNYKYGSYIGFYSATSAKTTDTWEFPNKYNEYYITNGGITYGYSGISETIGVNTYNAGMVSPSYGFEIPFDSVTKYDTISILANGITTLSGEYARALQAIKTKVYFADGTTKEEISLVGPFCYGYGMALYSMLYSDTLPRSEIGNGISYGTLGMMYPKEANIDSYFSLANNSIRLYYAEDQTTKAIGTASNLGRASTINIDADCKAVEKVSIKYATASDLQGIGGTAYDKFIGPEKIERASLNTYYVPIDKTQLKDVIGYESDRDYYMAVEISDARPVYLHGVTGVRTNASSYAKDIAEIENKIKGFSEEFDITELEDIKDVESRIKFLENQGVARASFDSALLEKLEKLVNSNVADNGHYEIYVSPNGNDSGYGYKDAPVKTLDRAKEVARTYKNDRPIDIILLKGEHNLTKTFELTALDSGTEENPVTIKGEGGIITTAESVDFNDFKLVKEGEDSRIATDLIGKIYKIDLNEQGIYPGAVPTYRSTSIDGDGFEDVTFFVNDKEQLVAQWPNGEGNYGTWVSIEDNNINAAVIKVDALRSKNWQGEKHAYFEGYPSVDYANERNNLTIEGDLIKFKNATWFSSSENYSRRYKIKHALSELDMPGEWYLDRDTNIFYYYPTEDFNINAKIQFASVKLDAVSALNADYVNFDGIKFDKIRGTAFTAGSGVENLNLYNCEFKNISNRAVYYKGTAVYNGSLASIANYRDAAKNCEIRNNRFINIGESAIYFAGGERETLSNGNNVIANNYIYNASNKQRWNPNIQVSGAYNYVLNNEIHMGAFHAINYSGNENVLAYNELYNMLRDTGDCGVIYNGRQLATRGTEIAFNYIHDYKKLDERTADNGVGIYLDDRLSGINIHHNIIFANGKGEYANGIQDGGGQHNKINYNTIVDADEALTRVNRFTVAYNLGSDYTAFDEIIRISGMDGNQVILDDGNTKTYENPYPMLGRNELYFERYPEMKDSIETLLNPNETVPDFVERYKFILELPAVVNGNIYGNLSNDINNSNDLTKYRILSMKAPLGNQYEGNYSNTPWETSGDTYDVYKAFGSTFDNKEVTDSTFVNYEEKDFRIADTTNGGALDENFKLSTIGLQEEGNVITSGLLEDDEDNTVVSVSDYPVKNPKALSDEDKKFNLTYPENNGRVKDKKNITFMWERPISSDYFTLEIATDPQMDNIVYKNENSYYNYETVTSLPENVNTFYWRVTARNIGKADGSKWQNTDGVNVFYTYDMAIVEMPATVPFNIEDQFNVDVFNYENETHNSSSNLGGKDATRGMYNLTNFKNLVPANGYYKFEDTVYYFPQIKETTSKNAISTGPSGTSKYTYTLKDDEKGSYDKIKLAMSAENHTVDYVITVTYTNGTKEDKKVNLYQYYTTYNATSGYDIILTVGGVNYLGAAVSTSNKNKIYEAVIDTDENKTVESISFQAAKSSWLSSAKNVYIFAITGVKNESTLANGDVEKHIVLNNYSGAEKDIVIIITGNDNGKFSAEILTGKIANSFAYPYVTVTIPKEVYDWTDRKVFIWENLDNMKPLGAKTKFFN